MDKEKHKWLVVQGCPRSGTTILTNFLNSHGKIALTLEKNLVKTRFKNILLKSIEDEYEEEFRRKPEVIYFGDKYPEYYLISSLVKKIIPQFKVIHILRNPIDTINSMNERTLRAKAGLDKDWNKNLSVEDLCEYWIKSWNFIVLNRKNPKILYLKYEDLVNNPDEESKRISDFLGLENEFNKNIIKKRERPITLSSEDLKILDEKIGPIINDWSLPLEELIGNYQELKTTPLRMKKIMIKKLFNELIKR